MLFKPKDVRKGYLLLMKEKFNLILRAASKQHIKVQYNNKNRDREEQVIWEQKSLL